MKKQVFLLSFTLCAVVFNHPKATHTHNFSTPDEWATEYIKGKMSLKDAEVLANMLFLIHSAADQDINLASALYHLGDSLQSVYGQCEQSESYSLISELGGMVEKAYGEQQITIEAFDCFNNHVKQNASEVTKNALCAFQEACSDDIRGEISDKKLALNNILEKTAQSLDMASQHFMTLKKNCAALAFEDESVEQKNNPNADVVRYTYETRNLKTSLHDLFGEISKDILRPLEIVSNGAENVAKKIALEYYECLYDLMIKAGKVPMAHLDQWFGGDLLARYPLPSPKDL